MKWDIFSGCFIYVKTILNIYIRIFNELLHETDDQWHDTTKGELLNVAFLIFFHFIWGLNGRFYACCDTEQIKIVVSVIKFDNVQNVPFLNISPLEMINNFLISHICFVFSG